MTSIRSNIKRLAAASVAAGGIGLMMAPSAFAAATANNTTTTPTSGTDQTSFSLAAIGKGYACPKATNINGGDQLDSFIVDNAQVPVSSLQNMTWDGNAQSWTLGAYTSFAVLKDPSGASYVAQPTDPTTGNYPSTAVGPFSYQWYTGNNDYNTAGTADLYPGTWNIGIACVGPNNTIDGTLIYVQQTITDTTVGTTPSFNWQDAAASSTPEFPLAIGLPIAGVGVLGGGALLMRRRQQRASLV